MAPKLKDIFFQPPFFEALCDSLVDAHPGFDRSVFLAGLYDASWNGLELKQRMRHASETLRPLLPGDYGAALDVLIAIEGAFEGFDHLLFADVVERFGPEEAGGIDQLDVSLDALEVFTRSTSEFAIRPFLRRHPGATFERMLAWSKSEHEHVRRLSSEGCRPRLPWASRVPALIDDPSPIWPILENLKADPSEYVRRSVANNLNDIAKDHPDAVLDVAERWMAELGDAPEVASLVKHGLRTLLKRGNRRALAVFGLDDASGLEVTALSVVPDVIPIGGSARLLVEVSVEGEETRPVRFEYEVHYARSKGKTSKKVFQLKQLTAQPGAPVTFNRKLKFADLSTRTHHPGQHRLVLVANGKRLTGVGFELTR